MEREGVVEMGRLVSEKPHVAKDFKSSVTHALLHAIKDRKSVPVWERFLVAYDERRKIPWLVESGLSADPNVKNGITGALRSALATYKPAEASASVAETIDTNSSEGITNERRLMLEEAAATVVNDELTMILFEGSLTRARLDVKRIEAADLQDHVIAAIDQYYDHREHDIYS